MSEHEQALARFVEGYDAFLAAFSVVPDEALAFCPPGDEYALGALPLHLIDPLSRYQQVLNHLASQSTETLDMTQGRESILALRQRILAARPTGAERAGILGELATAHETALRSLTQFSDTDFEREVPVIYDEGTEPYPSSASAVSGWLTDHYNEHVPHIAQLLAGWQASQ